jgi:hypothetical protein
MQWISGYMVTLILEPVIYSVVILKSKGYGKTNEVHQRAKSLLRVSSAFCRARLLEKSFSGA